MHDWLKLTSVSTDKTIVKVGVKKKAQLFGETVKSKKERERQEIEKKEKQIESENRRKGVKKKIEMFEQQQQQQQQPQSGKVKEVKEEVPLLEGTPSSGSDIRLVSHRDLRYFKSLIATRGS